MQPSCKTCVFFDKVAAGHFGKGVGYCRKSHPSSFLQLPENGADVPVEMWAYWPVVCGETDWCGEWVRK